MRVGTTKDVIIQVLMADIAANVTRSQSLASHGEEWQMSSRTFDRYWKNAKERQAVVQLEATEKANEAYIQASVDAAKQAVMSKQRRHQILQEIADGKIVDEIKKPIWDPVQKKFVIVTVNQANDSNSRIRAISEMNKMEGDYAPIKQAIVDNEGKILTPSVNITVIDSGIAIATKESEVN